MADSTGFETELDRARSLLDADDLTAVHVGVIHDDRTVDTVASRRTGGESEAELLAISLLATHIRAVAAEAGADYETVAADAAAVAAQLESLPVDPPADVGDEEASTGSSDGSDADG
ncbi:hypothetical protein [Halohasta salina]|uniref:hypothetical protein n=1 Tax=Halohasta salina TaxID=2961621 RepID=UPI0020A56223|nr:hypothetical protein [Halohasta salina]